MNGNQVVLAGRLTRDPDLRVLPSGQTVCKLGIACERRFKKGDEWEGVTSFFDADIWGDMAENVDVSLSKGDAVIVVGSFEQRTYETDAGEKRTVWDLRVDGIGVDLRWATAEVTRPERSGNGAAPAPARSRSL